ncbi:Ig-like domain-containing protein [Empedobacter sp. 225-1]|uniref:Ig-like domain-containing protein n=1 Tax=unclassified Empedobacter TaxID=2643773 RepID=UPI002578D660|nr:MULTISPECIES: Ig-like domain-containing protein [unclassified Empedobacter]MDM1522339.1 Ig-like domain-containing protein [Empedobacter sp. 225-1]MDM1541836.1 Ig-like domain-containing protein [Empedobacter sp. 189-2]
MNKTTRFSLLMLTILTVISCARQGSPTGGPKDETPPVFLKAAPDTLATNVDVNLQEATINFDEYIILKEYSKNVVISPSFQIPPIVTPQALAKKNISIKFQEPLLPNTTYSFNFGDAVQDFNENNKLSNFQYVFSTGSFIDSLKVTGHVNSSYDFKLPEKILVGLYKVDSAYTDSVVLQKKPYYIARANDKGAYQLNYLASGKYKLIAFEDKVENVMYDYGKERLAFHNEAIELNSNQAINLNLFNQKPAYRKPEASFKQEGLIVFKTTGATEDVTITPVGKEFKSAYIEKFPKQDSINFWFNPKVDTISGRSAKLKFNVQHKDQIDSISALYSKSNVERKLEFKALNDQKLAPNKTFKIQANAPIKSLDLTKIHVFKDTVSIPFNVSIDTINAQNLNFVFDKNLDEKFEVNIYPNALTDVLGEKNDTLAYPIKMGTRGDFGHLKLTLQNTPSKPFILQFLKADQNFTVLEEIYNPANKNYFEFNFIEPGEYLFRLLVDENTNGKWDTGDYLSGKQPEPIYLYPEPIKVRAMWEATETWVLGEANQAVSLPNDEVDSDKNRIRRGELKEGEERSATQSDQKKLEE